MASILATPPERKIKASVCRTLFGTTSLVRCPYCTRTGCVRRDKKFQCRRCGKAWSLTSLTWMKGMKLSFTVFWRLLWCYGNKVPVDQTQRLLRLSRPTVYHWFMLFRKNLPELDLRLEGTIQMDEAYFGGRKNGVAIIGAKQRGTRRVVARIIPASSVDRRDILPFIREHIAPYSKFCTDGASIYKGIGKHWPLEHAYDIHKKFEFAQTSEIEGFWGAFRTFIRRMYHHVTVSHLPALLHEYQLRLMHPEIFRDPASLLTKLLPSVSFA